MQRRSIANGYVIVYVPEHPKANNEGYVYEHTLVAEKKLGRALKKSEVVHHLDFNRANNKRNNLLVLLRSQHRVLHGWMDRGAPIGEHKAGFKRKVKPIVLGKIKVSFAKTCLICGASLTTRDTTKYCGDKCYRIGSRKVEVSEKRMKKLMRKYSWCEIGRRLGISDNGARRIARRLDLL